MFIGEVKLEQLDTYRTRVHRSSPIAGWNYIDFKLPVYRFEEFFIVHSKDRPSIQDMFPELTAEEREFLLTGLSIKAQEEVFGTLYFEVPEEEEA